MKKIETLFKISQLVNRLNTLSDNISCLYKDDECNIEGCLKDIDYIIDNINHDIIALNQHKLIKIYNKYNRLPSEESSYIKYEDKLYLINNEDLYDDLKENGPIISQDMYNIIIYAENDKIVVEKCSTFKHEYYDKI